jgi:uncharacterized membrane protein YdjX (TVP38/TMEM64 family)
LGIGQLLSKKSLIIILFLCLVFTGIGVYLLGGIDRQSIEFWLERMGIFAPLVYIIVYIICTILIVPSTPLNMSGGAIFGLVWGTIWTTLAAVLAAIIAFIFTRTIGKDFALEKMAGRWEAIDAEIRQGGLFYIFAIRLLPLIPYGIVNFAAGLGSISFRDYFIGTLLGTVPGIVPFVALGSGIEALKSGDILPFICALALTGLLISAATWYRRYRRSPVEDLKKADSPKSKEK